MRPVFLLPAISRPFPTAGRRAPGTRARGETAPVAGRWTPGTRPGGETAPVIGRRPPGTRLEGESSHEEVVSRAVFVHRSRTTNGRDTVRGPYIVACSVSGTIVGLYLHLDRHCPVPTRLRRPWDPGALGSPSGTGPDRPHLLVLSHLSLSQVLGSGSLPSPTRPTGGRHGTPETQESPGLYSGGGTGTKRVGS